MLFGINKENKPIVPRRAECKPGDIIGGKYRVESVLGEGAFGCVYKGVSGRDEHLNWWIE